MKKTLLCWRIFAAVLLLAISTISWANGTEINGIYYVLDSSTKTASVTYTGTTSDYNPLSTAYTGSITIPSTVTYNSTTYSVTSIGRSAFFYCYGLTSINIPNSVTSIGAYVFYGCSGLTSITIPNSVTSIGSYTFQYCTNLTSVTIPNSVTSIGSYTFQYCTNLTSITIPNSVTSIGNSAFYDCSGLTSITIPNSVTSIGTQTFYNCTGLTSVTIPESVTSIGGSAFYNCTNLTFVAIPNSVTSIGASAFYGCSGLTSVTIGNSVTSIGNNAFYHCSSLKSVTINSNNLVSKTYTSSSNIKTLFGSQVKEYILGDYVTSIGDYAFYNCSGLTSINIPNSVTSIGAYVFYGCSGLTSITIPNSVTSIGDYAFDGCSSLTSITIPNSVTSIGDYAFNYCTGLTSVTIPESVTSIGNYAFYRCSGLTSVTIGNSVTSIGNNTFYNCSSLKSVTINSNNLVSKTYTSSSNIKTLFGSQVKEYILGDYVTSIGDYAFYNCSDLTSVTIPNSVTSIGASAFYNCSGLTSITIPNSVTSIGNFVFYNCSSLTSITIPNNVTSIGGSAFYNCSGLTKAEFASIESLCKIEFGSSDANPLLYAKHLYINGQEITDLVIPNSVTSIGTSAFYNCKGLTSVTIPNSVTSIGSSAFYGCSALTKAEFASIESLCKISFGNSWANPLVCAKHLYINGQEITDLVIPQSVTSIGDYVLYNCSGLRSVNIPNSVTSISNSSFSGCSSLTSITLNSNAIVSKTYTSSNNLQTIFGSQVKDYILGDDVKSIGGYTFYSCSGLTSLTIPNSVTNIGNNAFSGCSSLTSITLNSNAIVSKTYTSSNNLQTIFGSQVKDYILGDDVKRIGNYAFDGCSGLTSVSFGNNVTSVGGGAFHDCHGLIKAEFASIESICNIEYGSVDANPLYYAKHLYINGQEVTDLVIPNDVTSIGNYVLYNCSGLKSISIGNSVTNVGDDAFYGCSALTSVSIGNSVTSISNNAFYGCSGLTKAEFASIESLSKISFDGYEANPLSYAKHLYINGQEVTDLVIPNSVTSIGDYVFYNCSGMISVTIPNSVTSISNNSFSGCSSLTSITLNSNEIVSKTYTSSSNLNTIFGSQVKEYIIGDDITSIGDYAFYGCSGLSSATIGNNVTKIGNYAFNNCPSLTSITIPDGVTTISYYSLPYNTKKYVNKGTSALLAAWKSDIIPYDLSTNVSLEKPTIEYSSTQTTVTVNVSPIYDGFTYLIDDVYYVEKEDDKITFDGLVPGGSKDIKLNVSLGEFSYSTTCYVSTQDMKQNVSLVKRSASSFEINGNYTKGDAEVVSESLTFNGITHEGNTAIFTGLCPQSTYSVKYNVTVKHGEETYTCTRGFDISTEALTFTTTQPKVISLGNAVVGATSNLDDAEENVGFEWRRTDWTDDFASNTGAAYLYEGTMEGYIRNLYTEKLWKVRPYYKSNDGKFYYGEWVGLDPTNTSYFEPTVHTYARIDQTENKVQISGYVQRGTDDVSKQGFKYWVQEDNARGAGISIPSGAKTIEAEGRVMEVELTGLKPNTTYAYVAFVTTTEGETFYGKQLSFTTGDDPEASVTGDANGNGVVEIGDVTSVLTLMATPEATGYNNKAADANGNGVIEIGDVTTILTIMAGN